MIDHNNLEEFNDSANFDLEEAEHSKSRIKFYADLAREVDGSVLEVACGTGLLALPVAARGLAVTGIDLARPMLVYARIKAHRANLRINLVEADARQFHLGHVVNVSGTQHYEPLTQILHWTSYHRWENAAGKQVKITRIACKFTESREMETLLHRNGFEITQQYGDWDQSKFIAESHSIISICRHKKDNL